MADAPLVYIVVGEPSGDALGADLASHLSAMRPGIRFAGTAGPRMQELGMESLFDITDTSVMGLSAVVGRLPLLLKRISETAKDIIARKPDVLVLIDSPDFNRRVAGKVRQALPAMKIVKYVCPSVWAWREGRAPAMKAWCDHVLALLPFEPECLERLGGPTATYVGHPLAQRLADLETGDRRRPQGRRTVLLLPGSRRNEIRLLLPDIRATVDILHERGADFRYLLPAVPHLEKDIRAQVAQWRVQPEIVTGEEAKREAFLQADVALAASGTVLLELALYKVPVVSIYRLDWLMHLFRGLIKSWTAALPNLITDSAFLPERVGDMVRPGWLARAIEELAHEGATRDAQIDGFERMKAAMRTEGSSGEVAARSILDLIDRRRV